MSESQRNEQVLSIGPIDELPSWAQKPLRRIVDLPTRTAMAVWISFSVLDHWGEHRPAILRDAMSMKGAETREDGHLVVESIEAYVQSEHDSGYSHTLGRGVTELWSLLESMMLDLAADYLLHERAGWQRDDVRKVRISIGDYHTMDDRERAQFVIKKIDNAQLAGVSRFKNLLTAIGLSHPAVDPGTKDAIYELEKVRNVLVHRDGRTDQRFLDQCPEYKPPPQIGEHLEIDRIRYSEYQAALMTYVRQVIESLSEQLTSTE